MIRQAGIVGVVTVSAGLLYFLDARRFARLCSLFRTGSGPAADQALEARVRSRIWRALPHLSSIQLSCQGGRVSVRGRILRREVDRLLAEIRSLRGVRDVRNELEVFEHPSDIPAPKGEGRLPHRQVWRPRWTAAGRLLAGWAGGALTAYGLSRRDPAGALTGVIGAGLLAGAVANRTSRRLPGL